MADPTENYSYQLSDYDFAFPESLIAQRTSGKGQTRILHVPRQGGSFTLMHAKTITELFLPGDCLVVNNTKVIPARLFGHKATGGAVEILLLTPLPTADSGETRWEAFVRPGRSFRIGTILEVAGAKCTVEAILADGSRILRFAVQSEDFESFLEKNGRVPLPPYIERDDDENDKIDYQTVFAKHSGAVAAPTASLHFSEDMIADLRNKGVHIAEVTLHVGPGTFQNIQTDDFREHKMHGERYVLSQEAAATIGEAKRMGGRVICVGTTSTRVLESVAREDGSLEAQEGVTHAFIYPGYRFKVVDGLLTNFHWPRSSLILLVSAFLGRDRTLEAYQFAVNHQLKLFSYGDGMLIL
jgi:S-adenosylmethionine:tRNA ribosyltransferase-isomerase